jgi:hypothetical protein
MGTLVIPDTTKTLIAMGGRIIPIMSVRQTITPNQTGSKPNFKTRGKNTGMATIGMVRHHVDDSHSSFLSFYNKFDLLDITHIETCQLFSECFRLIGL